MPTRKIGNHAPIIPAKGQCWFADAKNCAWKIVKLKGKTHIEVVDLLYPAARRKTISREWFMRTFSEGAQVWTDDD